jgi:hypothetical protein
LKWDSEAGQTYHIQCRSGWDESDWTDLDTFSASDVESTYTDNNTSTSQRFYRVTADALLEVPEEPVP